jgi:hypothetical protein
MIDVYKLDAFTRQFLETALWAECDHDKEDSPPLDQDWDITDFSEETILKLKKDCDDFVESNRELLDEVSDTFHVDNGQHGHDFWLTRNGHGAGFWDRSYGTMGEELTEACKAYGSVFLYIQDGKVCCD